MSSKAMEIIEKYADVFEYVGRDEAYLDVTQKTEMNIHNAEHLAQQLKNEIRNSLKLTCSIGISPNKLLSKIASDFKKPDGLTTVKPEQVEEFLSSLKANEIFELNRKHDLDAEKFIDDFKLNLAMSLSTIINIIDPDCFVFGGGVSNEIDFLSEIESMVKKFVIGKEYEGVFLKPKYGDASGVRGAARLGRKVNY